MSLQLPTSVCAFDMLQQNRVIFSMLHSATPCSLDFCQLTPILVNQRTFTAFVGLSLMGFALPTQCADMENHATVESDEGCDGVKNLTPSSSTVVRHLRVCILILPLKLLFPPSPMNSDDGALPSPAQAHCPILVP